MKRNIKYMNTYKEDLLIDLENKKNEYEKLINEILEVDYET